jgi:hypothetical protein
LEITQKQVKIEGMKNASIVLFLIFSFSSLAQESALTDTTSLSASTLPKPESLTPSNARQVRIGIGREHGMMTQQVIGEAPVLGVGMFQAKISMGNSTLFGDESEPKETMAASLGFLYPVSESFYVLGSTYYRDFTRKVGARRDEFKDIGVTFAVGNRWSFRSFELNAQWIGASPAIFDIKDNGEKPEMFLTLLNISAGVSF